MSATVAPGAEAGLLGRTARPGRALGWWGMVLLITTEAMVFAGLLSAYFFLRAEASEWPLAGIEEPKLGLIGIFTVVLLASSIPLFIAEPAMRKGRIGLVRAMLAVSWILGAAFLAHQGYEYHELTFGVSDNAYTALFYGITGLHGLHVLVGLVISLVVQAKAATGRLTAPRHLTLSAFGLYWHFVDAVWIFVFSSLYLSEHLG